MPVGLGQKVEQFAAIKRKTMHFLVRVSRESFGDFSADDLTPGRRYEVVETDNERQMVQVIDDSGEAYFYPAKLFEGAQK